MKVEEEIGQQLDMGKLPQTLIQMGFRKSTVYKVHHQRKELDLDKAEREESVPYDVLVDIHTELKKLNRLSSAILRELKQKA